jgi:ABC-type transport system involved in multi-copper enzyme maturation permease subunit
MKTGIILNILICSIISISTLFTATYIFSKNRQNKVDLAFAAFWFFVSLTWAGVALSLLYYVRGSIVSDLLVNQYIVQTLIFAQLVAGSYYGFFRVLNSKEMASTISLIFFIFSVIALYYIYQPGGLVHRESTYFSDEFDLNPVSWYLFQVMADLAISCVAIDLLRSLYLWIKTKQVKEMKYILAGLAVLSYGVLGYFDNQGYIATWLMVMLRLIMIFSALLAYLAYSRKEED